MEEQRLLTAQEAAELLQVSTETLANYRDNPDDPLPFYCLAGRSYRYRAADLEVWLQRQRRKPRYVTMVAPTPEPMEAP